MKLGFALNATALLFGGACGGTDSPCESATSDCQSSISGAKSSQILEVNVTNQPDFKNGQTAIVINPKNHNNLVFTATKHDLTTPDGLLVSHGLDRR